MKDEATVFVVDDDPSVGKALGRLLRSAGFNVELFDSAEAFLQQVPQGAAGCLVLDVHMPGLNGLELQAELSDRRMHLPIIFITGQGDIPMSVKAMKAGAIDFLAKPFEEDALLTAVETAMEKDRHMRREQAELQEVHQRLECLTTREREVFDLVITGALNKQIAAQLGTAEKTVKVHRGRMMRKMNVKSVAELVSLAGKAGVQTDSSATR
ncbi:MAG: response regulator transcription factor [Gammaproteobacteria bacterium]|nr:response regulator transcription factor [Gammaproteobacteria bacterium]